MFSDLNLSDDVAAATFMSIATSAPELFTNVIGTFITESDIGIGHVLGNAYFNMFFVAALGGFASTKVRKFYLNLNIFGIKKKKIFNLINI